LMEILTKNLRALPVGKEKMPGEGGGDWGGQFSARLLSYGNGNEKNVSKSKSSPCYGETLLEARGLRTGRAKSHNFGKLRLFEKIQTKGHKDESEGRSCLDGGQF